LWGVGLLKKSDIGGQFPSAFQFNSANRSFKLEDNGKLSPNNLHTPITQFNASRVFIEYSFFGFYQSIGEAFFYFWN